MSDSHDESKSNLFHYWLQQNILPALKFLMFINQKAYRFNFYIFFPLIYKPSQKLFKFPNVVLWQSTQWKHLAIAQCN